MLRYAFEQWLRTNIFNRINIHLTRQNIQAHQCVRYACLSRRIVFHFDWRDVRNNIVKHNRLMRDAMTVDRVGGVCECAVCIYRTASTILQRINFTERVHTLDIELYRMMQASDAVIVVVAAAGSAVRMRTQTSKAIARKMKNKYVTLSDEEILAALFSLLPFQMKSCKLIYIYIHWMGSVAWHTMYNRQHSMQTTRFRDVHGFLNNKQLILLAAINTTWSE